MTGAPQAEAVEANGAEFLLAMGRAGVAGVYFVFTVDEARGLGIGAALTPAPLREARGMGLSTGVLPSSGKGEPVYRRLGFAERCHISIYEWRAGATS